MSLSPLLGDFDAAALSFILLATCKKKCKPLSLMSEEQVQELQPFFSSLITDLYTFFRKISQYHYSISVIHLSLSKKNNYA